LEQSANAAGGAEVVFLRCGFLYGPGTWYTADGDVAEQVRQRQVPIVGEGKGVCSWIHIEDAARAAVLAIDRGNAGAYNIVDDDPSQMRVWLPAFAHAMGAPEPPRITVEQAGSDDADYFSNRMRGASNAKARRELGFQPRRLEWLA
jgi:nucleoside-diphosphate-sugar epimerase